MTSTKPGGRVVPITGDAMSTPFAFYESADELGDGMIANVRAGIASVDDAVRRAERGAASAEYFGRNWNALDEVFGDLSWLAPRRVVTLHADLPDFPADQVRVYLDVLRTAVDGWTQRPGAHDLVVAFPEKKQLTIRRLLA